MLNYAPTHALAEQTFAAGSSRTLSRALLVVFGVVLIALSAKVQVPFWPVPMTLQTFAIMAVFAAYGLRLSLATIFAYLAAGLAGAPVFAGPAAGIAYMAGPTAGFLAGFVIAALIVGYAADRGIASRPVRLFGVMLAADAVIFALGFAWLATLIGADKAFALGVAPFVLGDAVKMALAAAIIPAAGSLLARR